MRRPTDFGEVGAVSTRPSGELSSDRPAVTVALFTRDLRVHDNPVLHAASGSEFVVPLFVLDERIASGSFTAANRAAFLAESLVDLDASLRGLGARLIIRRGDVATETARIARQVDAGAVLVADDVTRYARARVRRLRDALTEIGIPLHVHTESHFVVPPGAIRTEKADHFEALGPYRRRWEAMPMRSRYDTPASLRLPPDLHQVANRMPTADEISAGAPAPGRLPGGESAALARLDDWLRREEPSAGDYDDFSQDATSRLSQDLHFGCLSALDARIRSAGHHERTVQQLALRDFSAQLFAAHPDPVREPFRERGDVWTVDGTAIDAWRAGRTGYPIIDACMRQLLREGWMHPQGRWIAGHFLTKTLYQDWRIGARHFADLLTDADPVNNTVNWQIVAGLGPDYRYNRIYDPVRQALKHDPSGDFVRSYVPELRSIAGAAVHEPWRLPELARRRLGYPDRIIDAREGNARFRDLRRASQSPAGTQRTSP